MKKILFILHWPPPTHGSSVVGQFIKNSKIINETFEHRYINLGTSKSIDEIGKNPLGKILTYLNILMSTINKLVAFKPDLCYISMTSNGIAFYKDMIIVLLVKLFDVKLVYHFHNKGVSSRQENFIDNLLYRIVFKKVDVILLSKYIYPDIQKYVPEERVHYCPNGIPDIQNLESKIQQPKQRVNILFLSNLIESKGVFVLLDVCKLLKEKQLPYFCTIVGGEGDINAKQIQTKLLTLGISEGVNYLGQKYGSEKAEVLTNADIFVFPTYYHNECFPLVILEAMQFSLPVIATFEGGIPDMVIKGETGFLCKQKDAVCLADKIEILIKDPELRKKMGNAGRIRYEEYFTLEHFENRFIQIFNKITR